MQTEDFRVMENMGTIFEILVAEMTNGKILKLLHLTAEAVTVMTLVYSFGEADQSLKKVGNRHITKGAGPFKKQ